MSPWSMMTLWFTNEWLTGNHCFCFFSLVDVHLHQLSMVHFPVMFVYQSDPKWLINGGIRRLMLDPIYWCIWVHLFNTVPAKKYQIFNFEHHRTAWLQKRLFWVSWSLKTCHCFVASGCCYRYLEKWSKFEITIPLWSPTWMSQEVSKWLVSGL